MLNKTTLLLFCSMKYRKWFWNSREERLIDDFKLKLVLAGIVILIGVLYFLITKIF